MLTLGLLAPVAASFATAVDTTAAPVAVKPDGEALIYIAGFIARAEKTGRLRYRIVIPAGAEISWLGMRGGEGRVGTFTPKALVAAWLRMGYRNGKKAVATLTWRDTGEKRRANHVLALLQGVARGGVEPPTFRFSVGRSYQLSYLAGVRHRSTGSPTRLAGGRRGAVAYPKSS